MEGRWSVYKCCFFALKPTLLGCSHHSKQRNEKRKKEGAEANGMFSRADVRIVVCTVLSNHAMFMFLSC